MAMLRGGQDLRGKRDSVDTGSGEKRTGNTERAKHLGRGSFVNFYDDLGISTTQGHAEEIRAQEAQFQAGVKAEKDAIAKAKGQLGTSQADLDKAKKALDASKIPGYKDALSKAWKQTSSSFVPVRVVDPSGKNVEAVYRLPKESISLLEKELDGFEQKFVDDGKHYNISSRHASGKIAGQEIHDALRSASQNIYGSFVEKAGPAISKGIQEGTLAQSEGYKTLAGYQGDLDVAKGNINARRKVLRGMQDQRAKEWADIRGAYQKKKDTLRGIFTNLKVGKGGENG